MRYRLASSANCNLRMVRTLLMRLTARELQIGAELPSRNTVRPSLRLS